MPYTQMAIIHSRVRIVPKQQTFAQGTNVGIKVAILKKGGKKREEENKLLLLLFSRFLGFSIVE